MPSLLGMELRGHLDLLLLATLRRTGPVHGYGLIGALDDGSDGVFDLPEGTVYPALHRLERDGFVTGRRPSLPRPTPGSGSPMVSAPCLSNSLPGGWHE